MKPVNILQALHLAALVVARPLPGLHDLIAREVPQEHSHEQFLTTVRASLNLNNSAGIVDPVFGLLGDAAAAGGKGKIADVECLQQATADQAFTNAKAIGDVNGQVAALIYRALERNTGKVGIQSNPCTSIKAVNPEIAAISQHQDPASTGAAAINKAVTLQLAKQIASVGGNPQDAIKSGTFAPGDLSNNNNGKGNTCDTTNDPIGCIFTENIIVPDAAADEINDAVFGGAAATTRTSAAKNAASESGAAKSITAAVGKQATASSASTPAGTATASSNNLQTFTGALGGAAADAITFSGDNTRPFEVNGNTFVNFAAAAQRTCDIQFNTCADKANAGASFSVSDCQTQENQCNAAQSAAAVKSFSSGATAAKSPAAASLAASSASATAKRSSPSSLDFGICTSTNPDIVFGQGFDGRTEFAFEPVDRKHFNHASAENIGVLTAFICGQLQGECEAPAATLATCAKAQDAAAAASGQAAADAWNAVFAE